VVYGEPIDEDTPANDYLVYTTSDIGASSTTYLAFN
jgi:hypothetical protein